MNTIWEIGEDDGSRGGCRTSSDVRSGGGDNGSVFKVIGVTKSMMNIQEDECNSSSSSSIGDDSDADREDVESRYGYDRENDNGFDDAIHALEQALPMRRGISTFYNGKSKSFACLADVWPTTSSVQDIAKPENAYTRKRRNLGAFKLSNINTRRICKKHKSTKLNFRVEREDPDFTKHATPSQTNRSLALRSFSMVNLHQTKIGNC
ncbi:hypothetical protein L1987_77635 [Smallanthus sonchifolius]|uniref:Uncharacterized protein n=1 Tax=Smallanthus sonchifolius TaxID=185202 RepID=A0ACB8ZA54_9ASTR|nr:hypothetical protein L1987_77635 [Smallanthus sonchifolius]